MQGRTPKRTPTLTGRPDGEQLRHFPATAESRIAILLGPERAAEVVQRCLTASCGGPPRTADELAQFADALIAEGGIPGAVGRTIKISAALRGARGSL